MDLAKAHFVNQDPLSDVYVPAGGLHLVGWNVASHVAQGARNDVSSA